MKSHKISFSLFLVTLCVTMSVIDISAETYSGSYDSIFIKPDARARGMGESVMAQSGSPSALLYNPAGLGTVSGMAFSAGSYLGLAGTGSVFLSGVLPVSFGTFGLGLSYFGLPDDTFIDSSGQSMGKISNNDFDILLGFGKSLNRDLIFGTGMKIISGKKVSVASGGFGIDAGMIYKFSGVPGKDGVLSVGLAMKDLLLTANLNLGINYQLTGFPVSFENDISYYMYGQVFDRIGFEYIINNMFSIRAGYKIGYDLGALSLGIGFMKGLGRSGAGPSFSLNYAFNPNPEPMLGQIYSFDVQILLPSASASAENIRKSTKPGKAAEMPPLLVVLKFKNVSQIEKLEPLTKLIPSKTFALLNSMKESGLDLRNLEDFGENPGIKTIVDAGVTLMVAGGFERVENQVKIRFMLVNPNTMEKSDKDEFIVDIKKGLDDAIVKELSERILRIVKEKHSHQ